MNKIYAAEETFKETRKEIACSRGIATRFGSCSLGVGTQP